MSIKERIEDGHILYHNGKTQGALLSVLIAVTATSRKRRPRDSCLDKDAFITFVGEEMLAITSGSVKNFNVRFREQMIPLQEFLYKFVRCELAHEARLPSDVRFVKAPQPTSFSVEVAETHISLSDT